MSDRITTEELADDLGSTAQAIYESRRRNQYPGRLGRRQGKRLMFFRSEVNDWLESVPKIVTDENGVIRRWETDPAYGEGETTNDANTAILWALNGIQETLRAIHNELRSQRGQTLEEWRKARGIVTNISGMDAPQIIRALREDMSGYRVMSADEDSIPAKYMEDEEE